MPAIPQLARIEAYFSDDALLALEYFLHGALRCHLESGYSPFVHVAGDREAGRRMALAAEQLHAAMERAMAERRLTPTPRTNVAAATAPHGHAVLGLGTGDGSTIVASLSRVLRDGTVFIESSIVEPIPSLIASLRTQLRASAAAPCAESRTMDVMPTFHGSKR